MSYRNSCARQGVVVLRGVIPWACSACVSETTLNQSAKKSILSTKPSAAIKSKPCAFRTRKITRLGQTEPESVHEIRFYCIDVYDIGLFALSPWANLCGCDGVDRQFRCRCDCVPIRKNGKSEGNIEGLLKLRDAALQLGISFPTIKQWTYKKKIRSSRTAGGHDRIPQSEVDRLLFRTRGKPEE